MNHRDGDLVPQLHEALMHAFPDYGSLKVWVRLSPRLNLDLPQAASAHLPLSEVVLAIINWAEQKSTLNELIQAAIEARPGDLALLALAPAEEVEESPIAINMVVVAMTADEAAALHTGDVFGEALDPTAKTEFLRFFAALGDQGITDLAPHYGVERQDWRPQAGAESDS